MKQVILVVTTDMYGEAYLDCMERLLLTNYDVVTFLNDRNASVYELGALKAMFQADEKYDEIFLVQDTLHVKDIKVLETIFDVHAGRSVFVNPNGHGYLCKYRREIIERLGIPVPTNKKEAVSFETHWNKLYRDLDKDTVVLCPEFVDGPKREHKYGRLNMVIDNAYFTKYKGTWTQEMIRDED